MAEVLTPPTKDELWKQTIEKYCSPIDGDNADNYRTESFWDLKNLLCDKNSQSACSCDHIGQKTNLPLTDQEFVAFCHVIKDFDDNRNANVTIRTEKALSLLLGCQVNFYKGDFEIQLATDSGNFTFIHFDDSDLESFATYIYLSKYL